MYSGVPEKAYKVFLKVQKKRIRNSDDFNTKNPAGLVMHYSTYILMVFNTSDAIMDMLNSENLRRAILHQCSQEDHHTQVEVKRALSSSLSLDGHGNTK